jgi:hypothetical protein
LLLQELLQFLLLSLALVVMEVQNQRFSVVITNNFSSEAVVAVAVVD